MDTQLLDVYTDYQLASFSNITATGLSDAVSGAISHDKITRFLSDKDYNSKQLWHLVKPVVRQIESVDGVIIVDDTIEQKPYTDESELITYHYDHSKGMSVKGINIISCLYHSQGMNIPIAFEPVIKNQFVTDSKTGKPKRKSSITKNEMFKTMLDNVSHNQIKYRFVLCDVWYAAKETMEHIRLTLHKDFIMPIKANRLIAFSAQQKVLGQWQQVQLAHLEPNTSYQIFIKGLAFPVTLCKQVFTNEDQSQGILYLVCSDITIAVNQLFEIYRKRWQIEPQYKSLKSNLGLAKSPTQTTRTQINHIFATFYAYFKLEQLKLKTGLNHMAIKTRLYLKALQSSLSELRVIKEQYNLCFNVT